MHGPRKPAVVGCVDSLIPCVDSFIHSFIRPLLALLTHSHTIASPCYCSAQTNGCFHPLADLLRMFFDCLYDEEVISEDAFYKWESSKDPAEQNGKGVALKSVTAFFTWLREAEEESEDN